MPEAPIIRQGRTVSTATAVQQSPEQSPRAEGWEDFAERAMCVKILSLCKRLFACEK